MSIMPIYGIGSQFEINLDARLPKDPLSFVTEASKIGLYVQYFMRNGQLWARVVGPFDTLLDFQSTL